MNGLDVKSHVCIWDGQILRNVVCRLAGHIGVHFAVRSSRAQRPVYVRHAHILESSIGHADMDSSVEHVRAIRQHGRARGGDDWVELAEV